MEDGSLPSYLFLILIILIMVFNGLVVACKRALDYIDRNVIKDYLHAFKNIEFAVYCSPRDDRNFKIFERVLKVYSR